jgi:glutamyl-tRNA reductase
MARGRKPRSDAVSQVHIYVPEEVQDYMARMGSMDSASKIRCLLKKAIEDRVPKTIIEIKAKLMEMERARRSMGDTTRACHNKLIELGQTEEDIDKIYEEINAELGKKGIE